MAQLAVVFVFVVVFGTFLLSPAAIDARSTSRSTRAFVVDGENARVVPRRGDATRSWSSRFVVPSRLRGGGGGGDDDDDDDVRDLQVSAHAVRGGRSHMEDEHVVADGGRFAAVFDGHGGSSVSSHLRRNLHADYSRALSSSSTTTSARRRAAALRAAVREADRRVREVVHWSYQGSTVVAVVVVVASSSSKSEERGRRTRLVALNVGDSRAVLGRRDGEAVALTEDHRPDVPEERRRIEAAGGRVVRVGPGGVPRVNGNLALSRAVGDRSERPCVTAEPDVRVVTLERRRRRRRYQGRDDLDGEFVVLGSDGLWDVMSNQEVVDHVRDALAAVDNEEKERANMFDMSLVVDENDELALRDDQRTDTERRRVLRNEALKRRRATMARSLVEEALRRGSTDNITAVIVWLRHVGDDYYDDDHDYDDVTEDDDSEDDGDEL